MKTKINRKKTGKSVSRQALPKSGKKVWLISGLALLVLLILVVIYFNYGPKLGQAYSIGETPSPGVKDLTSDDKVVFTVLPTGSKTISIRTPTSPSDPSPATYTVTVAKKDEQTYRLALARGNTNIAKEIIYTGGEDVFLIYLNAGDDIPDLEVAQRNGQISLRNLHFSSLEKARISLHRADESRYPSLIKLAPGERFTAKVRAVSSSRPVLSPNFGSLTNLPGSGATTTLANYTFTAPSTPTSSQSLLDIKAIVSAQETHAYYTIVVGDKFTFVNEQNYPEVSMKLVGGNNAPLNAQLNITFRRTTLLQPFAIPCTLDALNTLDTFLANTPIVKIYTYENGQEKVWNQGAAADDFSSFALFKGYFAELRTVEDSEETTILANCAVAGLQPNLPGLSGTPGSKVLPAGWSFISLPGTIPRPLTDFSDHQDFNLSVCSQGQQGSSCSEIPLSTPLLPGKPYWVKPRRPLTLRYLLE